MRSDGVRVSEGTVTLHRLTEERVSTVGNRPLDSEGRFRFELPSLPGSGDGEGVYTVSTLYRGIPYFGPVLDQPGQVGDSYRIQVYDTTTAPPEGAPFPLTSRSILIERADSGWTVTDAMQVRNAGDRTVLATAENVAWSHALPSEASDFRVGESDLNPNATFFREGRMLVVAPVTPGDHLYRIHYELSELSLSLPVGEGTGRIDVLIQEQEEPISVEGLARGEPVDLEERGRFLRFSAVEPTAGVVEIASGEDREGPGRGWWTALLVTLGLLAGAFVALRRKRPRAAHSRSEESLSRSELLLRIAELDEILEKGRDLPPDQREEHRAARRRYKDRLERMGTPASRE